ncbi:MAG: carboxypeptidase-like regulatory domain-containing protein [Chitinophagaceae bacterium]|nr:carboxypeptidase-like regulatory domain-containing protein [Chitinophagaceae bacterium]MBK8951998.1 carboxypeptidase-like regulatory domain-containing protein [Chitinophagaceae bacterium]
MQKHILSVLFIIATACTVHSQFLVSGMVLDSVTREPLSAASVFCQNTTIGTTTDKQGEFRLSLKAGVYDLIFSYTGYQTQTIRVNEQTKLEMLMLKEDKNLGEVIIKSSSEVPDGWAKHGEFFLQHFIGSTPNAAQCELKNPEVLKFYFYKRSNKLKVLATEPLDISNNALGYNLHYQLDSFVYYNNSNIDSYRGYCLYSEMEGNDSLKNAWAKNRRNTYEGSKLHFMRSYYDSTLIEDGWIIDMLDEINDKKFSKVNDVYDTAYYNFVTSKTEYIYEDSVINDSVVVRNIIKDSINTPAQTEIFYPRKISITYTKKSPEKEYLKKMNLPKNIPYVISYIEIKDWIAITENGYYYEQKDWINQGYWSWKNVADFLPYDYLSE